MDFTPEKFNTVKSEAEAFYHTLDKVWCPYFQEHVHFNAKGLDHLIFKRFNHPRQIQDQFSRLRHLHLAPEIVQNSKTLQGYWPTRKFERMKRKNGWEKILKRTTYFEFIAVMESHGSKVRAKVIVKQVEGGEKHFFSIIPFWKVNRTTGEKVLYTGNPESD